MRNSQRVAFLAIAITASSRAPAEELINQYNWTGFYLGGFAGGATGTTTNTTEPLRLDNLNFWFRPFNNPYGYSNSSSVIAGATIGYSWFVPSTAVVLGVEGEYGYLRQSGVSYDPNQTLYAALSNNSSPNIGKHWTNIGNGYGYGMMGIRIGYAFDRLLVYFKSGGTFTSIKTAYDSVKTEDNITPFPRITTYSSIDKIGIGVGGGVEFAILDNVSLKAEYLYLGINNTQPSLGYCTCNFQWTTIDRIGAIHTGKFGVNYRFSGFLL